MKKILLFTRCMGSGGTEKVIIQLAELYTNDGYEVVVCAKFGNGVAELENLGIKYIEIPDIQNKNPLVILKVLNRLTKILKEEKIDIVHTHHRMAAFYVRILKCRYSFLFLNNIHNTFADKKILTKFAFCKAQNIAVGESVKNNMIEDFHIPEKCIEVIYNAVNIKKDNFSEIPEFIEMKKRGKFIVSNIGRVNTQKGFEYYIDSAKNLKEKNLPICLFIVGDGIKFEEMRKKVINEKLEDWVYFLGFRRDIADIIFYSDIIVLSSLWEGFPLTPIETFGVGRTIIATKVPGTMEIVRNGYNGILIPLKDSNAIASAILNVYLDNEKKKMLEKNALETYKSKFSYEIFRRSYLQIIDK